MWSMDSEQKGFPYLNPYLIWGCAALFYMYQFVLRVAPSVLVDDLMLAFQVDASMIGSLSAISMYSYSLLQIPSGILADKYGVRRVILASIILCITGTLLFASTHTLWIAQVSRLILGIGSSAAFLCVGKVASLYFPSNKRALLFGFTMAAGTVGALNGGAPLCYLVSRIGWRESLNILGAVGIFVFGLNYLSLHNKSKGSAQSPMQKSMTEGFTQVLRNKTVWINSMIAVGVYLSVSVLADLWGPSFIIQRFQINKQLATETTSLMYVGLFTGSLSLPILSGLLRKRKPVVVFSTFSICLLLCGLLYLPGIALSTASIFLFLIGFFAGTEMLCFAGACEASPLPLVGTVTGFVNAIVMLTGAFIQHQVGRLLDFFWHGQTLEQGIRVYSLQEFQYALVIVPGIVGLSALASLILPESAELN